jgi:anti-sigma regulatory factor (Ser/Thr protein kinase)
VSLVYRDTLSLVGDPLRLKQILTNLVSNAIKFTREGTIVARAMLEDEHEDSVQLRISIQDTGIGLSNRMCALFQAFSQADNSLARQPGGTGLGLVISKRLIEQMGGEIGVDSTARVGVLDQPQPAQDPRRCRRPARPTTDGTPRGGAGKPRTGAPGLAAPIGRLWPRRHTVQHPGKPDQRRDRRPPDRSGDRSGGAGRHQQ